MRRYCVLLHSPLTEPVTNRPQVAMFLVAALNISMTSWPEQFRMQGDRRTVTEVLQWAEAVKGGEKCIDYTMRLIH